MTFSSMVKKLRIAYARRLLDTTEDSIGQVATQSGYSNLANFNRQFLAEVGMTPTAYRRLELAQKPPHQVFSLNTRAQPDCRPGWGRAVGVCCEWWQRR
jgi:AraC-like DNA-binding protein